MEERRDEIRTDDDECPYGTEHIVYIYIYIYRCMQYIQCERCIRNSRAAAQRH